MRLAYAAFIPLLAACTACGGSSPTSPNGTVRIDFDFNQGPQGWTPTEHRSLPSELAPGRYGLYATTGGENIFMFYKGRAAGLRPQVSYRVSFEVEIATNTPLNVVGAGGPPGESTVVKAGASAIEPLAVPRGVFYRMNIDKGLGSLSGADALMIGNIGISRDLCELQESRLLKCPWQFKSLSSGASTLRVQPAADGSLWFLVGTETGFFGSLELYYTRLTVTLTPE